VIEKINCVIELFKMYNYNSKPHQAVAVNGSKHNS
jgi:DNA-directed RNA polymerase subunit RPC12/RpoP